MASGSVLQDRVIYNFGLMVVTIGSDVKLKPTKT